MTYGPATRRNMSAMAWWLIPLGIVIAGLILLFGSPEEPEELSLVVTEEGAGYQRLRLPYIGEATGDLESQFRPLSSGRQQQLLSRLEQFRADYRPAAPYLRVWAQPGSESRSRVAEQLGRDLSRHELGKPVQQMPASPAGATAPLVLVCAEKDKRIAQRLLAALSVYLTAEAELRFDDSATLGTMTLYLLGEPMFDHQGVVVFTRPPG